MTSRFPCGDASDTEEIALKAYWPDLGPLSWDTDGDMLPDGWEIQYGLNPCECATTNSPVWDADGDGLGLFDEYRYCTDPTNPDTDGDGVWDGDEVPHSPGSCPNDADDGGDPANCVKLRLTVGDPSGSESERWNMDVFEEGAGRAVCHHCDDGFGTPGSAEYSLVKGKAYAFSLRWVATNLDEGPDYDWQAKINDSTEAGAREGLYGTGAFIVEDPCGLLTEYTDGGADNLTVRWDARALPARRCRGASRRDRPVARPPEKERLGMSSPGKHSDVVNASTPVACTLTSDASCKKLKF